MKNTLQKNHALEIKLKKNFEIFYAIFFQCFLKHRILEINSQMAPLKSVHLKTKLEEHKYRNRPFEYFIPYE